MSETWLRCEIRKGMFNDERTIRYNTISFFAPVQAVDGSVNEIGKVRVKVFKDRGLWWAVLPTDDQSIIAVDEKDLVAA